MIAIDNSDLYEALRAEEAKNDREAKALDKLALKDIHGNHFVVDRTELYHYLEIQEFNFSNIYGRICGMGMLAVIELRKQYLIRGGKLPITQERVQEIFQRKNIETIKLEDIPDIVLPLINAGSQVSYCHVFHGDSIIREISKDKQTGRYTIITRTGPFRNLKGETEITIR